jgi:hypothetical protein
MISGNSKTTLPSAQVMLFVFVTMVGLRLLGVNGD